ncbi:translation initiation factor IF-2-like [Oenanthe melanoleuca]|uniref:translation initiation factor IF-2-like n=1 Tax=Oenanthe melanoleuca TaxID=2939378 RepID=UPI0024C1BD9A|nr:translation initiation factor IF-2-like [Oenanthe melanoleuca]
MKLVALGRDFQRSSRPAKLEQVTMECVHRGALGRPHRGREHGAGRRRGARPARPSQTGKGRTGRERRGAEGKERKGREGERGPARHSPAPHPGSAIAPRPEPRARSGARTAAGRGQKSAEGAAPPLRLWERGLTDSALVLTGKQQSQQSYPVRALAMPMYLIQTSVGGWVCI